MEPERALIRMSKGELLRFFISEKLVKTAVRTSRGQARIKRALRTSLRPNPRSAD